MACRLDLGSSQVADDPVPPLVSEVGLEVVVATTELQLQRMDAHAVIGVEHLLTQFSDELLRVDRVGVAHALTLSSVIRSMVVHACSKCSSIFARR